jgi:hypothetical protein
MSILLHGTRRAYLLCHSDCATYGGLAAFNGDAAAEADHHFEELQRAADILKTAFSELQVDCFFVNFEGVFVASGQASEQTV